MKRRIAIACGVLVASYLALCIVASVVYPRMLFPAPRLDGVPPEYATTFARADGPKLVEIEQRSGGPTRAIWLPPPKGSPLARAVVMFHGNGESMFDELPIASELAAHGLGVMIVEYRGYGLTYGPAPSEEAMYDDGEAALRWIVGVGIPREQIVLWGYSLGTGVAAELAKRGRAPRLVLIAPYTSITAMGKRWAPFLPVSLLMRHHFDTLGKAPSIAADALVVHGDRDEVVPFEMGEAVAYALAHGRFLRADGAGHLNALADPRILGQVAEFVTRPGHGSP